MIPIESQEVMARLAEAEAFARAGDTRAALDRAKLARSRAKGSADTEACDVTIERLTAVDERRKQEVTDRHRAYVGRELAALPDYQQAAPLPAPLPEYRPRERRRGRVPHLMTHMERRKGETAMNRMLTVGMSLDALTKHWWIPVVRGIAAMLFGTLVVMAPSLGLLTLVMMWGIYAVSDGLMNFVLAVWSARAGGKWGGYLFEGAISIAAGVGTFFFPGITAMALLYLIAAWAVATGIAEIVLAIQLRHVVRRDWLLALAGGLSVLFGVSLFAFPGAGALTVLWMIGTYAIVFGALLIGVGVKLHRLRRTGDRELPLGVRPRTA